MKINKKTYPNGDIYYYDEDNKYHNEVGPAVESHNGSIFYYIHGKCHRLDGPAVEYCDGSKGWFFNGKFIPVKNQEDFERYLNLKAFH